MGSSTRLKDIAENLNLSIGTVQRALNNKGGYSPETQMKILEEAKRLDYTANVAASALRRPPINIAVVLPKPEGTDKYFFQYVWKGIENACQDLSIYNINLSRHYCELKSEESISEFEKILNGEYGKVNGVITNAMSNPKILAVLKEISDKGIPTFRMNATTQLYQFKNGFSSSSNMYVGQLCADIFSAILREKEGQLLLLGGYRESDRQSERINNFQRAMMKSCPGILMNEIHIFDDIPRLKRAIEEYLKKFDNLLGIYAVSARETLSMCEIVKGLGLSGKIVTVGIDVFPELLPFFEDGTLTSSIYQYPVQQGYMAVKAMVSDMTQTNFQYANLRFPATAVFKSNAEAFTQMNDIVCSM